MQSLQKALPLATIPQFDRDDLVLGHANRDAFTLFQKWPNWQTATTILIGQPGTGKSHMAACWAAKSGAKIFKPSELDLAAICFASGQAIIVEDMVPGSFNETALFHLINGVTQARIEQPTMALLLTSRIHPANWHVTLADLASRLKAAQLAEVLPPDDELLAAILTKLFADRQLIVEAQLIRFCLERMERSVEVAMRFVDELDRLALEKKSKITRQLVQQTLEQFYSRIRFNKIASLL